ncbi:MAG: hypothetical protein ACRCXT_21405 [Paraclostridium sp.]
MKVFKDYREVWNFLEFASEMDMQDDNGYTVSVVGDFIYKIVGYRKYVDTSYLNDFPYETLSKMLFGVIENTTIDFEDYDKWCVLFGYIDESKEKDYIRIREEERINNDNYNRELNELKKKYNK